MISITVIRGEGDILGEDIVDTLITNEAMAVQRGRNEIDASTKMVPTEIESLLVPGIKPGQIVEVNDSLQGETYRGKVTEVDIGITLPAQTMTIQLERV